MRVLAIASYGQLGGSELHLAGYLEHRPADVVPHALLVSDGPLRLHLAERGIPTFAASGFEGRPDPAGVARFTRLMTRLLERVRPDVVWAVAGKAALLAAPACRLSRVPLVWHKVDFAFDRMLTLPLAACVSGVTTVSWALAESLGPLRRRRLLGVVPPALRMPPIAADPDPRHPLIGTLGRLVPRKGHHHIIEATAQLVSEHPDLRVVLAGAPADKYPDYPDSLAALARDLGIGDRLELPGFVDDVAAIYRRLTVFVNATYRDEQGFGLEGLGGSILEASWAGVPVVATDGGGAAEAVRDGETGTLVPASRPDLLAEAIRPYLRDPDLARSVGAAGMRFARDRFAPGPASRTLFHLLERAAARSD